MRALATLAAVLLLSSAALAQNSQSYDVLIRNGNIVDGSGNPWFHADIGIIGDRIAFIGTAAPDVKAKREIDARGLVVAPGFIDMLGQSEQNLLVDKQAVSKLTQGITTEITGEGESIAPVDQRTVEENKDWSEHFKVAMDWKSLDQYFARLAKQGSGVNLGTYVGATQVREIALGRENRAPTAHELEVMQEAVQDAMYDGAFGVSSSLIYAPAAYAKTDELIALAKVAAKNGGIYASHIRNEGDSEMQALDEVFKIAREANIPVEIFHLKVSGKQNWGKMKDVLSRIEQARAEGLDITADQYPYVGSATSLDAPIPPKFKEGGKAAFIARLKDPAVREQIRAELSGGNGFENMWRGVGGPDGVMVISVLNPQLKQYEGKTVAQIAAAQNKDPFDTLLDLVIADNDNASAVYFSMNESDVRLAMQQPWVSVGTDYGEVNPEGPLGESKSHPRAYGSFARILGKYVREEKLLRLEDAVRKMTSLAAQRVKLEKRGVLKPDYYADVTIFNPQTVNDVATFENPNRTSVGIEYVLVNGVLSLEHGKVTGQLGGRPLRGPAYINRGVAPEGLRMPGKIQGVITGEDGYPMPRTTLTLLDASGTKIAEGRSGHDGRYEIPLDKKCQDCKIRAERMGFKSVEKKVDFNGVNSLWFSFALASAKQNKTTP